MWYNIITVLLVACCVSATNNVLDKHEPEVNPLSDDIRAQMLLGEAFKLMDAGKCLPASESFERAINTGSLNFAGKAVAYWHIAECFGGLGDTDEAAEAYTTFIFFAKSIIDMRSKKKFAVVDGKDFVEHFDLKNRLNAARAYINILLVVRSDVYGHSVDNPIRVSNSDELEMFIILVAEMEDCVHTCSFVRQLHYKDGRPVIPRTERIIINNDDGSSKEFFAVFLDG